MAGDSLNVETTVVLAPDRAFELFTAGMASWWPREYTWSQDVLEEILIEPGEGGFCVERGPHGFTVHWGRVETWEPPGRLVFTWQIGPSREPVPDPNRASEVEVHFTAAGNTETRVELEHRHFSRYGEAGGAYHDAMASPQGWPHILDRFAE
jgi:uncharacterized protein YndB with AHSA1/START domain